MAKGSDGETNGVYDPKTALRELDEYQRGQVKAFHAEYLGLCNKYGMAHAPRIEAFESAAGVFSFRVRADRVVSSNGQVYMLQGEE